MKDNRMDNIVECAYNMLITWITAMLRCGLQMKICYG